MSEICMYTQKLALNSNVSPLGEEQTQTEVISHKWGTNKLSTFFLSQLFYKIIATEDVKK